MSGAPDRNPDFDNLRFRGPGFEVSATGKLAIAAATIIIIVCVLKYVGG